MEEAKHWHDENAVKSVMYFDWKARIDEIFIIQK